MLIRTFFTNKYRVISANFKDFLGLFALSPIRRRIDVDAEKRVLVLNWRDTRHKYAGGAEVYVHELSKQLVQEGMHVTWFCGNDGQCPRYEVIDGIHIIRRGGFYMVYLWGFLYYQLRFRKRYHVVIDCENGIPFFTPLFVRKPKLLVIFHIHREVFHKSLPFVLAKCAEFLELKVTPFLYQAIDVITISQSTKKQIIDLHISKNDPYVIYPGVDTTVFVPGEKSETPMVLYVGRLKDYKSVDVLIKAVPYIIAHVPDVHVHIVGEGEEKRKLRSLAKKLGVEEYVHFHGKITEKKKVAMYQQAWVSVNPSFMEGWGITSIESSACGTPVVASDVPGLCESVQHNKTGYLVPYGGVDAFAERITTILCDPEIRTSLGEHGIQWAQRFDWKVVGKKYVALVKKTIITFFSAT